MSAISEKEVLGSIQEALNIEGKKIILDSSVEDVPEWDSLGHLSVLTALDKLFEGKIAGIKELASADSVKKIIQILHSNSLI